MANIKVIHITSKGLYHNWRVYEDDHIIGYVHCNNNGEDFGGRLGDNYGSDKIWEQVQELCMNDLADQFLLDKLEQYQWNSCENYAEF